MSNDHVSGGYLGKNRCKCGSYAINPHLYGREKGVDTDLCDVCYWRKRAEVKTEEVSDE